jgi:carboxyl-terminal processing protease
MDANEAAADNPTAITGNKDKLTLWSLRIPRRRYLLALCLALALAAGTVFDRWLFLTQMPSKGGSDFRVVAQAWNIIYHYYVDRDAINSTKMAHQAVQAMTDSLGDRGHSVFLSKQTLQKSGAAMKGKFSGIGIEVQINREGQPVIVAAVDGSPAFMAGLRGGEVIVQVDDHPVTGLPPNIILGLMGGPEGQPVKLTVYSPRKGRQQQITVTRASFNVSNVTWHRLPGTPVAHLRIAMFSDGVAADLQKALLEIQQQGLTNLILDLRDDPGGVLAESISVASQFLDHGNVLLEKHANGKITPVAVQPGGVAQRVGLVVLVNSNTASASEIVAGALQDAKRAKLVGEKTFGTGTVLSQFPLLDGSALLLAVEEWLTPGGRSFWHNGIDPDIAVPAGETLPLRPSAERGMTPESLAKYGDQQLLRALQSFKAG